MRHTVTALAVACLALAACTTSKPARSEAPRAPATTPATTAPAGPDAHYTVGTGTNGRTAAVPRLVGKELSAAREEARAAGFRSLRTHDALGRGRTPAADQDWKVCTQMPGFGQAGTGIPLILGVAKRDESCFAEKQTSNSEGPGARRPGARPTGMPSAIPASAVSGGSTVISRMTWGAGGPIPVR
ncbi:hypothetical protein AB0D04_33185 [Streptomyces sp. NPDC048483]|uniref:hypothetical protein n=1 Tax=Streptomyces sp. NPDC048483 TaxID=3154927 RepID=UPI00341342BC